MECSKPTVVIIPKGYFEAFLISRGVLRDFLLMGINAFGNY